MKHSLSTATKDLKCGVSASNGDKIKRAPRTIHSAFSNRKQVCEYVYAAPLLAFNEGYDIIYKAAEILQKLLEKKADRTVRTDGHFLFSLFISSAHTTEHLSYISLAMVHKDLEFAK